MKTIKVKIRGNIERKINFCVELKKATNLMLKPCKNYCDSICDGNEIEVDIHTSKLDEFKTNILKSENNLEIQDISYQRNKKLLQLGLGSKDDYVKLITHELTYKNKEQLTNIFSELPKDILSEITNKL